MEYFALLQHHSDKKIIDSDTGYGIFRNFAANEWIRRPDIRAPSAILQQMSGFADRIFGYFEISLQQVQVPGTGTVSATQILISEYW